MPMPVATVCAGVCALRWIAFWCSVSRSVCSAMDCICVQCVQECVLCVGLHVGAVCAGVCVLRWTALVRVHR